MKARHSQSDPMETQIEQVLCPGEFIHDRACFSFIRGLEQVANAVEELITTEATRAVALCEAFLAGCHAKAEQLDDSSGNYRMFVTDLICLWIKARRSARADPDDTAATLFRWMDDDPYAFCHEIEKDTSAAFDEAGRTAFEKQARERFEAVKEDPAGWPYRRLSAVLRAIYFAQSDVLAYVQHAERTGLTSEDCLAVAKLLAARKPPDALAWVERGLAMNREKQFSSSADYGLNELHRELLVRVGRGAEALQAAWADFQMHPSKYSYEALMKFAPEPERATWHEKAMEAAVGTHLQSQIDLFVETKEIDRLAELVRRTEDKALEAVSHYATEPAAETLEETHPELAARLPARVLTRTAMPLADSCFSSGDEEKWPLASSETYPAEAYSHLGLVRNTIGSALPEIHMRPTRSGSGPSDVVPVLQTGDGQGRICPACGQRRFVRWPWGWDAHAAHSCTDVEGETPEQRKKVFKNRFLR